MANTARTLWLPGTQCWSRVLSHLSRLEKALCHLFPLHWQAQGAAMLPGRCARLWFDFAGCRLSRKPVAIRKLLFKKSKCCQWCCLQPSILCEAALPRSHCLQNGVGERNWELPLPAQPWEPLCYSECEEKPANSDPFHNFHHEKLIPE